MQSRAGIVGALALAAMTFVAPATAQDFVALPAWSETRQIEGIDVRIDVGPDYRITPFGTASLIEIRVRIGLADLQAKAPAILTALAARHAGQAARFSFPRLDQPVLANGALWVSGVVRVETRDPLFGGPIVETAQFTIAFRPEVSGASVGVGAHLTAFDMGGGLMGALGVEAMLRDFLEGEIRRGLAESAAFFDLPATLQAYGITMGTVELVSFDGLPGLVATASATLDGGQLMTAVIDMAAALAMR